MLTTGRGHRRQSLRARRPARRCGGYRLRPARLAARRSSSPADPPRLPASPSPPACWPRSASCASRGRSPRKSARTSAHRPSTRPPPAAPGHRRASDPGVRRVHPRALRRADGRAAPARDRRRTGRSSSGSCTFGATTSPCRPTSSRWPRSRVCTSRKRFGRTSPAISTTLLLAAERHPAMILYLDNQASMGAELDGRDVRAPQPRPRARLEREPRARDPRAAHARRRRRLHASRRHGIREGADGLVDRRRARRRRPRRSRASAATPGSPGEFHFRALMHEPGDKTVLGKRYRERGADEGEDVLRTLALHPKHRAASRDEARAAFRRRRSAGEARRAPSRRLFAERRRARERLSRVDRGRARAGASRSRSSRRRTTS